MGEIADPIGMEQEYLIALMQKEAGGDVGQAGPVGQRRHRHRDQRRRHMTQHHRADADMLVDPALDQGVPERVQHGRAENGDKDDRTHPAGGRAGAHRMPPHRLAPGTHRTSPAPLSLATRAATKNQSLRRLR